MEVELYCAQKFTLQYRCTINIDHYRPIKINMDVPYNIDQQLKDNTFSRLQTLSTMSLYNN